MMRACLSISLQLRSIGLFYERYFVHDIIPHIHAILELLPSAHMFRRWSGIDICIKWIFELLDSKTKAGPLSGAV